MIYNKKSNLISPHTVRPNKKYPYALIKNYPYAVIGIGVGGGRGWCLGIHRHTL